MFEDAKLNVRANGRDVDEYEGSLEGGLRSSHRNDETTKSIKRRNHMTKYLIEEFGH
jgi:hypothetical protein